MERESIQGHGRREQAQTADETLGTDDQEFSSVEDVGNGPSENPAIDDV
jgi:hypothetical protein